MAVVKIETPRLIVTYAISLFWGIYVCIKTLWQILKNGPSSYFHLKDRSKRPKILDNGDLGTHAFVKLSQVISVFFPFQFSLFYTHFENMALNNKELN